MREPATHRQRWTSARKTYFLKKQRRDVTIFQPLVASGRGTKTGRRMLDCAPVNLVSPIRFRSAEEASAEISWWQALLAAVMVVITLLAGLGTIGLIGPDEPRYAAIARAMAQTGDWVTPRLYGHPWFEKPALYYWGAGLAFRLVGTSEIAARLPSALAALFTTVVMAWAALRAWGLNAAWLTLVMLPTAIAMPVFARAATPDMLFSAALAGAAVAAAEILAKPRAGVPGRLAFGICLGAATLAKGPAAIILAGGAVFLWALAARQWRAVLRLASAASVAAFCVVAVPWYALVAIRNPEFLRIFFLEHNFQRYLTPVFHHPQPFWFFSAIILALIFPWTALLLPLAMDVRQALKTSVTRDSAALFFGCWAVFPIIFFSFSQSKLPAYILPAVPPLILLLAASSARQLAEKHKAMQWGMVVAGCMFVALSLAARQWLHRQTTAPDVTQFAAVRYVLLVAMIGGVVCILAAIVGRVRTAVTAAAVLMAVLVGVTDGAVLPN